jgi:hypothetical protein
VTAEFLPAKIVMDSVIAWFVWKVCFFGCMSFVVTIGVFWNGKRDKVRAVLWGSLLIISIYYAFKE